MTGVFRPWAGSSCRTSGAVTLADVNISNEDSYTRWIDGSFTDGKCSIETGGNESAEVKEVVDGVGSMSSDGDGSKEEINESKVESSEINWQESSTTDELMFKSDIGGLIVNETEGSTGMESTDIDAEESSDN